MRILSCLTTEHNLWLVALATVICVLGCYVGLDLAARARDRSGRQRTGWVFLTAVALGASVWCTHFVAMLAYKVSAPITLDPLLTLVSLLVAIGGTGFGLHLALQPIDAWPQRLGGAVTGASIAMMHYTGMAAYRVDGFIEWDEGHIVASVVVAMLLSMLAFHVFQFSTHSRNHVVSLSLFVAAIVSLHFTGMSAMTVVPAALDATPVNDATMYAMAVGAASVALIIVGTGVTSHFIDSSQQSETERFQKLATTDFLTGLANRARFQTHLSRLIESPVPATKFAVIGLDLDNFKEINDLRGHEAGDRALKVLADRMREGLDDGEFVARIGGDEFAATKVFGDDEELDVFLERTRSKLLQPVQLDDYEVVAGASIGVALYPRDGTTLEALTSNADRAMYRAKATSGNAICFYDVRLDETCRHRRNLALDLRHAIERGELSLHYQVQKSIVTGETCGYEALLRWTHPVQGAVSPADFIPLAEETGAIIALGDWVLLTACREAASWPEPHRVAVNISPIQLSNIDLAQRVQEILLQTGLASHRLELEITETAIIKDKQRTLDQLRHLRALGITIAIDDFGIGYSSLDALRSFPFNKIKIDRSFTQEFERDAQTMAIVRALLALGKSLNISILAEGVETRAQLALLAQEGCDEAQGYYLGRPAREVFASGAAVVAAPSRRACPLYEACAVA